MIGLQRSDRHQQATPEYRGIQQAGFGPKTSSAIAWMKSCRFRIVFAILYNCGMHDRRYNRIYDRPIVLKSVKQEMSVKCNQAHYVEYKS